MYFRRINYLIEEVAQTNGKANNNSTDSVGIIGNLVKKIKAIFGNCVLQNFRATHNTDLKIKQATTQC